MQRIVRVAFREAILFANRVRALVFTESFRSAKENLVSHDSGFFSISTSASSFHFSGRIEIEQVKRILLRFVSGKRYHRRKSINPKTILVVPDSAAPGRAITGKDRETSDPISQWTTHCPIGGAIFLSVM